MTEGGEVLYAHVTYSTIHDRLKFYLQTFGIGDTHYTLHAMLNRLWSVIDDQVT